MKNLLLYACCLAVPCALADSSPTNTLTVAQKVEILWTAHTNRLAEVEARKAATAKHRSAIDRVRENAKKRKRRSVMPKSAGGVK